MSAEILVPGISGLPNKTKEKQLEETLLQGFSSGSGTGELEPQVQKKVQNHKAIIYYFWLKKKSLIKSDGLQNSFPGTKAVT